MTDSAIGAVRIGHVRHDITGCAPDRTIQYAKGSGGDCGAVHARTARLAIDSSAGYAGKWKG